MQRETFSFQETVPLISSDSPRFSPCLTVVGGGRGAGTSWFVYGLRRCGTVYSKALGCASTTLIFIPLIAARRKIYHDI